MRNKRQHKEQSKLRNLGFSLRLLFIHDRLFIPILNYMELILQ